MSEDAVALAATPPPTKRRNFMLTAAAGTTALFGDMRGSPQALPRDARGASAFDDATLPAMAQSLATRPHRRRSDPLPRALARLDYDGYRRIGFNPERALWAGAGLPFQMQPHHRGFLFQNRVELFEVSEGAATPITYQAQDFSFDGIISPEPEDDLGFAGFRILFPLNRPDHFDELCVFLGASYFRAVGRGQVYGISARGLAVRTADAAGEEFPAFTGFWIERPVPGATSIRLHALLESESVTGAYRFDITPGETTRMEVEATLFPRRDTTRIGVAPATSMFFFAPQDRDGIEDFRPAVHDSDGLLMLTGSGEQIWRPLANPRKLETSGFQDRAPRGFGLLQRERGFANYQDLEAAYHRRPSLWIEPIDGWGDGEVHLVEIPTRSEIHDNSVAAWSPRGGLRAGQPMPLRYRLHWGEREHGDGRLLRFTGTRSARQGDDGRRLFVLDTAPFAGAQPEVSLTASAGKLRNIVLRPNPETGGLRLTFELEPGRARLAELQARLLRGGMPISESWVWRWTG